MLWCYTFTTYYTTTFCTTFCDVTIFTTSHDYCWYYAAPVGSVEVLATPRTEDMFCFGSSVSLTSTRDASRGMVRGIRPAGPEVSMLKHTQLIRYQTAYCISRLNFTMKHSDSFNFTILATLHKYLIHIFYI